ncbi:unnamed protein product [Malus baccata var. baccata]
MVAIAATTYEEARNQRLEENKRKFQDLGISSISKTLTHLTASPNKTQHRVSKPKARNACLDIEPRRSSRQRNSVQTYRDDVDIDLPPLRKRSRSSSSFCGSYLARPMEEVRLCSYEERQAALKAAERLLENLQTDNPSFVKTMVRSHVYSCFWLGLPTRFCDEHLSKTGSDMVLEDEHGNEYDAVYIGSRTGLSGGWRAFALEHKLDDGDALVFELTEPTRFKIYIVKVSSMSSIKSFVDKEDIPSAENTSKTAVKPDTKSTQNRRTKRGSVSEIDDSQSAPVSESDQRRRSKRGIVPPTDDTKAPRDLESNQIRRSKRGAAPVADDSKTNFNSESNQLRRSKRGAAPVADDSKTNFNSESNQQRRSRRGTVPAMDDTKASPDLGSDQKRRSKRGVVSKMDDLETSPKLPTESPKGCETEQEACAMKVDEVAPKQVRKKAKASRVRFTESPEGCEVKPEVPEKKPEVTEKEPEVEEKNARAKDENECVAKKPRKKVLQTTRSSEFMGFRDEVSRNATLESDIIVVVIGSGIWPKSKSFKTNVLVLLPKGGKGILSKVASLAAQELSLAWGFKAELKRLRESLLTIQDFLGAVSGAVSDQPQDRVKAVEEWVMKLKGIAHDAEDVMDEFDYEVVRRKVELQNHMKKKVLNFFSLSNPLAFRLKMAHKIQKINQSLVDLKRDASFIGLVSKKIDVTPQESRSDRQTDSFIGRDEITVGRGEVVSNMVTTLTNSKSNQENLMVMAIVGMGGLGKTTLAKSVYNEDSIRKFFEKRIWVCVSDTFDVDLILLKMLQQLKPANAPSSKDNQEALLKFLKDELNDKRYLFVLDDVWNEDPIKWENLMECLSKLHSAGGSKIIVTTRSGKVASISKKLLQRYELGKLSVDECWSIMKNRAFPKNADIAREFHTVGLKIATNCGGIPLVAKVLGGILCNKKNIEEWSSFQKSRIWENLSKGQDRIMPVLKLSFDNLSSPSLKQCFAYCSMFKKDFEIQRDNLIQLWMAQGLLHPSPDENKDEEDIGNEYFDILLQSSLFQDATTSDNDIVSKCKMHDLAELLEIRGMANLKCVGAEFYGYDLVHNVATPSKEIITLFPALKVLYIWLCYDLIEWKEAPTMSAQKVVVFPCLEKLEIGGFCLELDSFPDFPFGSLMHLTTLRLYGWPKLKSLPQQIQHLTSLTLLIVFDFEGVETLPEWLGNLTSLTELRTGYCKNLTNLPSVQAMQRLTKLHYLYIYECPLLKQRCSRDNGTDWPKISHIPYISSTF